MAKVELVGAAIFCSRSRVGRCVKEVPTPCLYCSATATTAQPRCAAPGERTFRRRACRRTCNGRTGTPCSHLRYPTALVLLVALWRLRYELSLRGLAGLFLERGFVFTHEVVL